MKYAAYINGDKGAVIAPKKLGKKIVAYVYTGFSSDKTVGLVSRTLPRAAFDRTFKLAETYPVEKLAEIFYQCATHSGASPDVIEILGDIIDIDKEKIEMDTSKIKLGEMSTKQLVAAYNGAAKTLGKPEVKKFKDLKTGVRRTEEILKLVDAKKPAAKPATKKPAAKAATKKPAAKKPAAKAATKKTEPSAASMFKELIMAGKKTDDQIFDAVQKKFNLDDDKRRYVAWYRNNLKKTGVKNVPDAK